MDDAELECELDLTPTAEGDIGLAFAVRNTGSRRVEIRVFRPFLHFDLTVEADDGPVPVIQPAYNVGLYPHTLTIGPGATVRLETPIQLRFDPQVPANGGDVPTRWSLLHDPAPVRVQATLQIAGIAVAPCAARYDPQAAR